MKTPSSSLQPPSLEELRAMTPEALQALADMVKQELMQLSPGKKAHLESSLGVTELSIALHARLNTPQDLLIWDVGHQAYVHKWLTGRAEELVKMRTLHGISGFPRREESLFDPFGTGHSSTSISALGGLAMADRLKGISRKYVAVIGDGALTAGQAFEALNHLSDLDLDLLVILNDNSRSLDLNVGALHHQRKYAAFFDALNWNYTGPVDGHRMRQLLPALEEVLEKGGLQLLHVQTRHPAFDRAQGSKVPKAAGTMDFSEVFGACMQEMLEEGLDVAVVSPAMIEAAWLGDLRRRFPHRVFDTGITEQHAVTFSAGLAAGGQSVFCHLYSSFSQRAIDQIIHDVALQHLPVTFVLDRAGITGSDGPTHHGVFDVALFRSIPNMEIWDAANGDMLTEILRYSLQHQGPLMVRIPKAETFRHVELDRVPIQLFELVEGEGGIGRIVLGHAQSLLPEQAFAGPMAIIHRVKPFPVREVQRFAKQLHSLEVWEDGSAIGGLWEATAAAVADLGIRLIPRGVPDRFIAHGKPEELWGEILGN